MTSGSSRRFRTTLYYDRKGPTGTTLWPGLDRCTVMTTVRIALTEPWPGQRMGGHGFRISSFLVVLADESRGPVEVPALKLMGRG